MIHQNPSVTELLSSPAMSTADLAPTTPDHEEDAPILATPEFEQPKYEEPLYTEINIPLPPLPKQQPPTSSHSSNLSTSSSTTRSLPLKSRSRAHSLTSLSPFSRSRSSSSSPSPSRQSTESTSRSSEEWPRVRRAIVKSRETAVAMNLNHQNKRTRNSTIDALAVVPAVLMLSAELFTPGSKREGRRKDSGVGRWEDGIR